jgi:cobalt-zinc-cadmium resistance protein CzcA
LKKLLLLALKQTYCLTIHFGIFSFGVYSIFQISIGAVPDVTNNQVQVITTSQNLSTQDIEQYITYPVEIEMANLPGVKEIRSISKFGLSVVTIVFEDDLGTYLPRQLIAEKSNQHLKKSHLVLELHKWVLSLQGLEKFTNTLEVKPEFKDQYSVTDLRTIQDWVVAPIIRNKRC